MRFSMSNMSNMSNERPTGRGALGLLHQPNRRRMLYVIAAVALSLFVWFAWHSLNTLPTYQGKTVAQWLNRTDQPETRVEVVNAFGPDAALELAKAIRLKQTFWNRLELAVWEKLPKGLQQKWRRADIIGTRSQAARWLIELGADGKAAVPELIDIALQERDVFQRCHAINVLGFAGRDSPEALSALTRLLNDSDVIIQDHAALALGRFGSHAKPAVRPLIEYTRNHPQKKPFNPLLALGQIGKDAEEAVPAVVEALKNAELKHNGLTALVGIGSTNAAVVPIALKFLEDQDYRVKARALDVLRQVGPEAKPAAPTISRFLQSPEWVLRALAAVALSRIEGKPEMAVPVLQDVLTKSKRTDLDICWGIYLPAPNGEQHAYGLSPRETAARLLGQMGPAARAAMPELFEAMQSSSAWLRVLAAQAIWRIEGKADAVCPVFADALTSRDEFALFITIDTLHEMGPAARPLALDILQFVNQETNAWSLRRELLKILKETDPALVRTRVVGRLNRN